MLARSLLERGHAVRGTTRDPRRRAQIEALGVECVIADPDRVGSLIPALEHVTVAVILLGSARAGAPELAELHGPRLERLATRLVDTTVHGVVYEAAGTAPPALLAQGAEVIRAFGARSRARWALVEADPSDPEEWLREALAAVEAVLGER